MANCPACGAPVEGHQEKCSYCGAALPKEEAQTTTQQPRVKKHDRSKIVAAILAFFLGTFGADLFYLGKTKEGVIYLLVSYLSCGIGATVILVLSIIHMVQYLMMTDEEFDEKYNY